MKTRVISASVLIAIVLACVLLSTETRILLVLVAAILCSYEWAKNLKAKDIHCAAALLYEYATLQACLIYFKADLKYSLILLAANIFAALLAGIVSEKIGGKGAICTIFAFYYPLLLFALVAYVCVSEVCMPVLALACFSTWICDSFALFGGSRFGKHKLAPKVSPNKTWEGSVCGAIFSLLGGLIAWLIFRERFAFFTLPLCLGTALLASSLGQVGDLAESLLKRMLGVKDFSNLIPGHGGVFDRVDSLLFAIPTTFLCVLLAMGAL